MALQATAHFSPLDGEMELEAIPTILQNHSESEIPTHIFNETDGLPKNSAKSFWPLKSSCVDRKSIKKTITDTYTLPIIFFKDLKTSFGMGLLGALLSEYLFVKGIMYHLIGAASAPILREGLHVQAERLNVANAVTAIPWSIKAIIGSISDMWPVFGYHKRPYMLISAFIGFVGAILSVAMASQLTYSMTITFFFMMMLQASFNDLLCEGAYTRRMAEEPQTGASLTSFVWLCASVGSFFQALWVGPMADNFGFWVLLVPLIACSFQQLVTILYPWPIKKWSQCSGMLPENYETDQRLKVDLIRRHWRVFMVAFVLAILALGSVVMGLLYSKNDLVGLLYSIVSAVILVGMILAAMPRKLIKPVLFVFLHTLLMPTISPQLTYWLKAEDSCVPGGPNFDWTFLLTYTTIVQSIFQFIGVGLFQRFVSKWTFRNAFVITSIINQIACVFDVILVKRWNSTIFHIGDKAWYFFSAAIIEEVVSMWAFMPGCVLISRLCPKNIESTTYAIVAGLSNFGRSLSRYIGNFIAVTLMGIKTLKTAESGGCNFENLPLAIILVNGFFPCIPLLLTFFLVPNVGMDVHIATDDDAAEITNQCISSESDDDGELKVVDVSIEDRQKITEDPINADEKENIYEKAIRRNDEGIISQAETLNNTPNMPKQDTTNSLSCSDENIT